MIVGSGIGGAAAAWDVARFIPDASITLLGDELPYVRHKMRYLVHGLSIDLDTRRLESSGVEMTRGTASRIHRQRKAVEIAGRKEIPYDHLVLATGASSSVPRVPGGELARGFRKKEDAESLIEEKPSGVAIIGASYVAMHAAETCIGIGSEPTIIVRSRLVRKSLEPELSAELESRLQQRGVGFVHSKVKGLKDEGVEVEGGKVEADVSIAAIGITPLSKLGREAGLEMWWDNIRVDRQGRSSDPRVFAIGDVSNCYNQITGEADYFGLGTVAAIMAYNATMAISGSKAALKTPRYIKDVFFGETYTKSIGYTAPQAQKAGMDVERIEVAGGGDARGYLVYEKVSKRLVGFSALSKDDKGFDDVQILNIIMKGREVDEALAVVTPVVGED